MTVRLHFSTLCRCLKIIWGVGELPSACMYELFKNVYGGGLQFHGPIHTKWLQTPDHHCSGTSNQGKHDQNVLAVQNSVDFLIQFCIFQQFLHAIFNGYHGSICSKTDIFNLGCILYKMGSCFFWQRTDFCVMNLWNGLSTANQSGKHPSVLYCCHTNAKVQIVSL